MRTSSLSPLIVNDHIYSYSTDELNILNDYFIEQSSRDETCAFPSSELCLPDYIHDLITVTPKVVKSTLSSLLLVYAAGSDAFNIEL